MPPRVTRAALIKALRRAKRAMRWASQQAVPAAVRVALAEQADKIRRLLDRLGKK